ncbi:MAG: hypothetical protein ACYDA2_08945 [Acidimicrobiales bacterium]
MREETPVPAADPADAAEQEQPVQVDDEGTSRFPETVGDRPEADALEQEIEVPLEDDERP